MISVLFDSFYLFTNLDSFDLETNYFPDQSIYGVRKEAFCCFPEKYQAKKRNHVSFDGFVSYWIVVANLYFFDGTVYCNDSANFSREAFLSRRGFLWEKPDGHYRPSY